MNMFEWGATIADLGTSIYEEASLPKTYWKQDEAKYEGYPIHAPPTLSGVGDGVVEEITSIPQLVKLGAEVATDKEKAIAIWNSVKSINLTTIRNAAVGTIKGKWDKYAESPGYVAYHELGKDGVSVANMMIGFGGIRKVGDITEAVEETGAQIKKSMKDKLDEIESYFTTPEFSTRLNDRFKKYKGQLSLNEYAERYKTLYKNREIGKVTEEQFQVLEGGFKPKKSIKTSDGRRYFDNVLDDVAKEVKSGPVTLIKYKDQLIKDIEILEFDLTNGNISKIEWHCFDNVDKDVFEFVNNELKNKNLSEDILRIIKY
jgi:hypothetical protein